MAYDEELVNRIRELLGDASGWTEKAMFGGLAFLIDGNLAISASGQGGVLVRADPAKADGLIESSSAIGAVMGGREMRGWLRVGSDDVRTRRQLERWVRVGATYAASLPPKKPKAQRRQG